MITNARGPGATGPGAAGRPAACAALRQVLTTSVLLLAAALPGFVVAHVADVPPAQMTVALLCAALLLAWARSRR